jgi:hypothetical protein
MRQKTLKMKWISVKDKLPEIPKGKYAVQVLGSVFDQCYESIHPGHGYKVYEVTYAIITRKLKKESKLYFNFFTERRKEFITLASGPKGSIWVPIFDPITHWMYLPEPPNYKIKRRLKNEKCNCKKATNK